MPRGGKRPGAGRKKGSADNRSVVQDRGFLTKPSRAEAVSGLTPLDYMLSVLRDPKASVKRRDEMAIAAAPYVHAILSVTALTMNDDKTLAELTTDELIDILRGRGGAVTSKLASSGKTGPRSVH